MLKDRQASLAHTFVVNEETPTDASGTVTVTVKRLDGTSVTSGPATSAGNGRYTFTLPPQANVDTLTVDWSGTVAGQPVTERDVIEIVGGFLFDLVRARDELGLKLETWPTSKLAPKRLVVEDEAEGIAGIAFAPRFSRRLLDGTGTVELPTPDIMLRTVRAVKVADGPAGPFTVLDTGALAAIAALPEGVLIRDSDVWPAGHRNIIVEYEHGVDYPPAEVTEQAILRLRTVLSAKKTAIPDRAISWTVQEGGVYRFAQAGQRSTGFPDIDAAYRRAGQPMIWIAS